MPVTEWPARRKMQRLAALQKTMLDGGEAAEGISLLSREVWPLRTRTAAKRGSFLWRRLILVSPHETAKTMGNNNSRGWNKTCFHRSSRSVVKMLDITGGTAI